MARIKLSIPDTLPFSTHLAVRITDLNYGGHVGNDTILTLIHEARMQYLKAAGYSELDLEGVGLIMADVAIEFKNELFYGDQLQVSVGAADFSRVGFDIFYRLEKTSSGLPVPIAIAKTGMVCFNYQLKKVVSVPSEAVSRLS